MTAEPTPRERVALFALMVLNEEVTNIVLKEHVGVDLEGASRRKLNDLKLVSSTRRGRAYWHELTDDGWAWCWDEMARPAPTTRDVGIRVLYPLLGVLRRYCEREDLQLSYLFGQPADPGEVAVEDRIRSAYRRLAAEPDDWVSLTGVRNLLGDVPAAELDDVLRRLGQEPGVHLVPETDQRRLTPEDRMAAVCIGGKDKHLLKVDRS